MFGGSKISETQNIPLNANTAQKIKFSNKDFFSKCDQIRRLPQIWSHLLKKSLMENLIFCTVLTILVLHRDTNKSNQIINLKNQYTQTASGFRPD